jgi:hypothetical protein
MQIEKETSKFEKYRDVLLIGGSVSSIAAVAVVILDKVATVQDIPPQYAGWRIVFFFVSIFGIGGISLFTYHWAKNAYTSGIKPVHTNMLLGTFRLLIGTFFVGVFIDAFFAAVYWTQWMRGAAKLVQIILNLNGE